jgi:hypothetical protein
MEKRAPEVLEHANVPLDQRQKRKARLYLVRRGALATACLLIGVCVYSVLDPVPLGTANSFFSRARGWIGNVLNLDLGMDAPPPSDFVNSVVDIPPQMADCKTIEEVHAAYGLTVYEPAQIQEGMKLCKVQANIADGDLIDFSYRYEADEDNWIIFTVQPMPDEADISFPEDSFSHTSPAGEFRVFKTASGRWLAVAFTKESILNIKGTLSKDGFLKMLDTLRQVN